MSELFIISPSTMKAYDEETIKATADDLHELGMFSLPYDRVDIRVAVDFSEETKAAFRTGIPPIQGSEGYRALAVCTSANPPSCIDLTLVGVNAEGDFSHMAIHMHPPKFARGQPLIQKMSGSRHGDLGLSLASYLIVLLATRNVEKTVRVNKLAKLGIGKKNPTNSYSRVTTITIPEMLPESEEHPPTGRTVCPHLRRGHIRRQHYGPERAFIKRVWIAPIFVNADEGFVSQRQAYNLSL